MLECFLNSTVLFIMEVSFCPFIYFLFYFGLFWRFVDGDVVCHRWVLCTYYAAVQVIVLLFVVEFCVLIWNFFGCDLKS
jgi:hypothetical protein